MKKFWKTHFGQCIYQTTSGISVYQNPIYRWLTLNSQTLQSLIHRHSPERAGLRYIQALTLPARLLPANCCLLGLGGAGVAHTLDNLLGNAHLDAIEINPEIIQIAADYFMTTRLKHLHIIQQDAYDFVQRCQKSYLHLMIDLFNADSFPTHCNQEAFFGHCQRLLLPGGVLAINLANAQERDAILNAVRTHFNRCTIMISIGGSANWVILAYKGASIFPLINLLQHNDAVKNIVWDSQWGYITRL